MDDLNSRKTKNGDAVRFKVREGIRVDGVEIIPADSPVEGHVAAVGRSNFAGHSGKLDLSVDYAVAINGAKIPLRGEATLKGGSNGAVTAAATAYWGPPALLIRGWEADIHKGTMLNAYVNGDQPIALGSAEAGNIKAVAALDSMPVDSWSVHPAAEMRRGATGSDPEGSANSTAGVTAEGLIGVSCNGNPMARLDGIEISSVQPKGPADTIDLKPGDVILAIDDHYLFTINELRAELLRHAPGARLTIRYRRNRLISENHLILAFKDAVPGR